MAALHIYLLVACFSPETARYIFISRNGLSKPFKAINNAMMLTSAALRDHVTILYLSHSNWIA